jgi:hypothetical protein
MSRPSSKNPRVRKNVRLPITSKRSPSLSVCEGQGQRLAYEPHRLESPHLTIDDHEFQNHITLESVDVNVVVQHYHRGLQGSRDELSTISTATVEIVYAGSLLLAALALASLRLPFSHSDALEHHENIHSSVDSSPPQSIVGDNRPPLNWLHHIRNVASTIDEHLVTLRMGRLRAMLPYPNAHDGLKSIPASFLSSR